MLEFTLPSKDEIEHSAITVEKGIVEDEAIEVGSTIRGTSSMIYDSRITALTTTFLLIGMQIMKNRFEITSYNSITDYPDKDDDSDFVKDFYEDEKKGNI